MFCESFFNNIALAEVNKLSTNTKPRYSGGLPSMIVPVKIHEVLGQGWRPRLIRAFACFIPVSWASFEAVEGVF